VIAPPLTFWVVEGAVLAGKYPGPRSTGEGSFVEPLVELGVRTFLDLTEEGEGPLVPYADRLRASVEYHRIAIPDVTTPRPDQVREGIDCIEAGRTRGVVYVHCRGGCGRTGVVIGAYLVHLGSTPQQALDEVHAVTRALWHKDCPETEEQVATVLGWS
jgi:hypothetical protein